MKSLILVVISFLSLQSHAFKIECLSENNLDISQIDFRSLTIERTPKGNWITINGMKTQLGDALPYRLSPAASLYNQAESFTVLSPLQLGMVTFPAGTWLSYVQNRMELQKYRDTVVSFVDYGKRMKLDIECQLTK